MKSLTIKLAGAALALVLLGLLAAWAGIQHLKQDLPSVASLSELQLAQPLHVYSRDGKLIGEFGAERRALLKYQDIPPQLVHAFLAAEDDRFFEHPGVDWQGLARASLKLAASGEKAQGGSTITMQLARNVFLSNERTFTRKFREILLALRIEDELSKEQILELYLNKIFLGERAYGVGAAALVYFGKDVHELSLSEAAVIAGLPKAPSRDNPVSNPQRARERRDYVLSRMHTLGYINDAQYQEARAAPVAVHPYRAAVDVDAQYLAEMVRTQLYEQYGEDLYSRGLSVITTIDSAKQAAANGAVRRSLLEYNERHAWRGPEGKLSTQAMSSPELLRESLDALPQLSDLPVAVVTHYEPEALSLKLRDGSALTLERSAFAWANWAKKPPEVGDVLRLRRSGGNWRLAQIPQVQGAFVALSPSDGAIQALVGGFDFFVNRYNRVTQARRQVGSGFKPFLYAAGMAYGYTPASVFLDAPVVVGDGASDSAWRPENYEGDLQGPMRLREALVHSRNLVSIRLLQAIGLNYARDFIPRFGLPADRLPNDLTMALGSAVFTPLELARGYATFANGGFVIDPYFIAEVRDAGGKVLFQAQPKRACPLCGDVSAATTTTSADSAAPAAAAAPANTADSLARSIDPRVIWLATSMMHDVTVRGTGAAVNALGRVDLAGKTGTTNDETDAWFDGFQKDEVGIAWVGFDQPTPLGRGEVGARAALPIWIDYMRTALKGVPQQTLPQPTGLVSVRIDPATGKLAAPGTTNAIFETVQEDHVPEAAQADEHEPGKKSLEDLY
ncbi:penicillin-binding protein 1A [Solimonas aquatica]|uniref:Penicillin-binding protein 1A n=1 Tax=Solimonas aquatica TaxID=489703 RepID=A0A1H9KU98_9GAMM|nr:penicillin-binding protein 1A [Solimonas aquatica]SER02515.1 penicillin-binding protein 1A [Solimonas aquatica]